MSYQFPFAGVQVCLPYHCAYHPDFIANHPFQLYPDAPEQVIDKFEDQQSDRDIRTQWDLGNGRFEDKQWYRAFNHLKSLNLKKLILNSNHISSIIKNMQTVQMFRVQQLDLQNNQIETLENFQSMFMPNLQYLKLGKNKVRNFQPFKKLIAPFLQIIELEQNLGTDFEPFVHMFRLNKQALILNLGSSQLKRLINIEGLLKNPYILRIKNLSECYPYQVKSKRTHSIAEILLNKEKYLMGQDEQKMASAMGTSEWNTYQQQLKSNQKSNVIPYYQHEIKYLEDIFDSLDTKKIKSIELANIDQIFFMKEHPLYQRIRFLFQQETKKLKVKKVSFDIMLHLFTPFHIMTDIQTKYKYLFRLYDWDRDFKLSQEDVLKTFEVMFHGQEGGNNYGSIVYNKDALQLMANEAILRYGVKGEIKFQNFREFIPQNQVKEIMTLRFNPVE